MKQPLAVADETVNFAAVDTVMSVVVDTVTLPAVDKAIAAGFDMVNWDLDSSTNYNRNLEISVACTDHNTTVFCFYY